MHVIFLLPGFLPETSQPKLAFPKKKKKLAFPYIKLRCRFNEIKYAKGLPYIKVFLQVYGNESR